MVVLVREAPLQLLRRAAVADGLEHPGQELLGRLAGLEVQQLLLLAREHQARLELQQGGDEDEELRRDLEIELALRLEVVEVGQHDIRELDLEQIDLFPQDEGQQQVERPAEDVEVQLELGDGHRHERQGTEPLGRRER